MGSKAIVWIFFNVENGVLVLASGTVFPGLFELTNGKGCKGLFRPS